MLNNEFSKMWLNENQINILKNSESSINPILATKILNSVKKIVDIVHSNNKYQIVFNSNEESGYINYSSNKIVLSSALLKDIDKYSIYDIIDLEAGLALHESGHAEYSFDKETLKMLPMLSNLQSIIYNIVEDAIMEEIVSKNFPGFKQYFLKLRGYYFKNNQIKRTNDLLNDRVNELLIGLRYPGDTIILDDKVKESINIINNICNSTELHLINRVDLAIKIHDILISNINNEKDKDNKDDTEDDGDFNTDDNNKSNNRSNSQNIDDELNKSNNSSSGDSDSDSDSDSDDSKNIDRTVDDIDGELKEFLLKQKQDKEYKMSDKDKMMLDSFCSEGFNSVEFNNDSTSSFNVIHCKPKINNDIQSYNKYKREVNKYIVKIRNNFADANTIYKETSYGLSAGMLDDDSLYSAKYNRNIFMNNTVMNQKRTKNLDIMFVIDNSGSMNMKTGFTNSVGRKLTRLDIAKQLCTLFIESLSTINSINTWVCAFQTSHGYLHNKMIDDYDGYGFFSWRQKEELERTTQMINLYSPTNKNKYSISKLKPAGLTPEYQALSSAVEMLKKEGKKLNKKIIIMLTDGEPGDQRFSLHEQLKLIKDKLNKCKKENITVIHLALTNDADKTSLYENKIQWNKSSYDELLNKFIKTLKKQL